jgi:GH15 family glucan-1,4-alpha-glucosidase
MIVDKANALIAKTKAYIEKCYNADKQAYAQAVGSKGLDASNLQLITLNYLNPHSDRALLHIKAHEKELFDEGLFFRYSFDDLGKPENSFLICGFWYAETLAATGQLDKAVEVIDKLLQSSNHLGLFSEDADKNGGQWGNFPQTYSHVGLINAIYRLAIRQDKPLFI